MKLQNGSLATHKDFSHTIVRLCNLWLDVEYGLGAWLLRLGLVLSFVTVNLSLALVTFLVCRHCFVHDSFYSLDPCELYLESNRSWYLYKMVHYVSHLILIMLIVSVISTRSVHRTSCHAIAMMFVRPSLCLERACIVIIRCTLARI